MQCAGHREHAIEPQGPGGVPLDRNSRELMIRREGWNGQVAEVKDSLRAIWSLN